MITMTRALKRRITKLFVTLGFCASVFLILLRIKSLDMENESSVGKQDSVDIMRVAMIQNNERIARVKRVCRKYRMGSFKIANYAVEFKEPPVPQYNVLYIDRKRNISYCPIYKSGSTTWLYNLCLLNGITEEELSSEKEQISVIARKIMPALDYPEADELLNKTVKYLVVRHPFERLLSAYRDKLENSIAGREHGTLHFYKKYGQAIVRKYRDESRPSPRSEQVIRRPGLPGPAGTEPTWREFVDYLINTDLASYADDHWMPYYLYCTPCLINYDFIAKVETLMRDQVFALDRMGLSGRIRPRWEHRLDDEDAAKVYFSQLTKEHVRKLHDKFKLDFELFGYFEESYYRLATSIA